MRPNIHQLSCLIRRHAEKYDDERSDADLLALFAETRDEAAFEQLLRRYGPMVYAICRRALPTTADAEDAYQATFLALVRRCRTVRHGGALGGWLHATAIHSAAQIVRRNRRREAREQVLARAEATEPGATGDADLARIVDEELAGLPDRYRAPIVLCRVRGVTLSAAAEDLGLSIAGVWKRVQRGENLLRDRLIRRGVAAPAAGLAAVLMPTTCLSAVRPELLELLRGTLARESVKSATVPIAWWYVGGVVALGAVLAAAASTREVPVAPQVATPVRVVPVSSPAREAARAESGKGWTVVRGLVIDADGHALPRAALGLRAHGNDIVLTTRADAEGTYQFVVPDLFWNESDSVSITVVDPPRPHVRVPVLPPYEETRRVIPVRVTAAPLVRPAPPGIGVAREPTARAFADTDPSRRAGVAFRGRVVDGATGRPVAGARVQFLGGGPWHHRGLVVPTTTDSDGGYELVVPDRNGTIAVTASEDYRLLVRDATVAHPIAGEASELFCTSLSRGPELPTVRLVRGETINGSVRFPDGTPLAAGSVWCEERFGTTEPRSHRPIPVVDGKFVIRGCDPRRTYSVVVTDRTSRYAAAATLKVNDGGAPLTLSAVDHRSE